MDTLVKKVSEYVERLFQEHSNQRLSYHNVDHTRSVVNRTQEICEHYQISEKGTLIVMVAAWFHDVGYNISGFYDHERKSVAAMKLFLSYLNVDEKIVNKIAGCIMSTKFPPCPANFLEKVLCDADTYHLGTEDFWQSDIAVKRELETITGTSIADWNRKTLLFLKQHQYFTGYCKDFLTKGKLNNIMRLSEKITYK